MGGFRTKRHRAFFWIMEGRSPPPGAADIGAAGTVTLAAVRIEDAAFVLAFSLIMLNTNQHIQKAGSPADRKTEATGQR